MTHPAVFLPGSVLPAQPAYGALVEALGDRVDAVVKDLELYAADEPTPGWSLDTEVAGALREADARGWERFHLVGYSGGGAAALAVAATHPSRLLSLALLEPAWAGSWDWSAAHAAVFEEYDALLPLEGDAFMAAFGALNVAAGVAPPQAPPGPAPWMAQRPAGIKAFLRCFRTYDLPRPAMASFPQPVYLALGGLSNQAEYGEITTRLSGVFPDVTLEVFEERHHFDPPHRAEPERLARSLLALWDRAGTS